MGMMINCATLSRRLMFRVHTRTEVGVVLSVVRLGSFGCATVAALARGMHNPRAMQARSRSGILDLILPRTSCWLLVLGCWWHVETYIFDMARFVEADQALGVGFDLVF